jgi:hypothetical protein
LAALGGFLGLLAIALIVLGGIGVKRREVPWGPIKSRRRALNALALGVIVFVVAMIISPSSASTHKTSHASTLGAAPTATPTNLISATPSTRPSSKPTATPHTTAPVTISPAHIATTPAHTGTVAVTNGQPEPDHRLTPGAVLTTDINRLCPHVDPTIEAGRPDESVKDQVYAEYGITSHASGQYEIDHLIPLELGGANTISNLWPELNDHPAGGGLNTKDGLEDRLHTLVCDGQVSLTVAQQAIASNWWAAYQRYMPSGTAPVTAPTYAPPPPPATTAAPAPASSSDVYYANCTAARAAGAAPLYRGQPGYRSGLDRDGDGIACES